MKRRIVIPMVFFVLFFLLRLSRPRNYLFIRARGRARNRQKRTSLSVITGPGSRQVLILFKHPRPQHLHRPEKRLRAASSAAAPVVRLSERLVAPLQVTPVEALPLALPLAPY